MMPGPAVWLELLASLYASICCLLLQISCLSSSRTALLYFEKGIWGRKGRETKKKKAYAYINVMDRSSDVGPSTWSYIDMIFFFRTGPVLPRVNLAAVNKLQGAESKNYVLSFRTCVVHFPSVFSLHCIVALWKSITIFPFYYTNIVYKNIEAEICQMLKNTLRITPWLRFWKERNFVCWKFVNTIQLYVVNFTI